LICSPEQSALMSRPLAILRSFRGLRGRLFIVMALVILTLVAADLVNLRGYRGELLRTTQVETANLSRSLAEQMNATFDTIDLTLTGVREGLEAASGPKMGHAQMAQELEYWRNRVGLHRLMLVGADGHVVAGSAGPSSSLQLNSLESFTFHKGTAERSSHLGRPARDPFDGSWAVPLSLRVDDAHGGFGGVLVATISTDRLREQFRVYNNGSLGICLLASSDAVALARWPTDPRGEGQDLSANDLFTHVIGPGDRDGFTYVSAVDFILRQGSYHRLRGLPALVMVSRSRAEILAPWRRVFAAHAVGSAILLSLIGVLAHGLARNIGELECARSGLFAANARLAKSERAAVRANASLEMAAQIAQVGHWHLMVAEPAGLEWSDEVYRIHGLTSAQFKPTLETALDFYHDADRPAIAAAVALAIKAGAPIEFTARINRADGSLRHVLSRGLPQTDAEGMVVSVFGVLLDVSEQQRNEDALRTAHAEAEAANEALEAANRALEAMAMQDALTGLANRRQFDRALEQEFRRAVRAGSSLALVLIDVDHFKQFNDIYGHVAGDHCLRTIAAVIPLLLNRPGDSAARYGGEEMAVLLPGNTEAVAISIAGRIADAVRALGIPHSGSPHGVVTISAGVEAYVPVHEQDTQAEMIERADRALYAAKRTGRDRVVSYRAVREKGAAAVI